jgi:hypothetical protein
MGFRRQVSFHRSLAKESLAKNGVTRFQMVTCMQIRTQRLINHGMWIRYVMNFMSH